MNLDSTIFVSEGSVWILVQFKHPWFYSTSSEPKINTIQCDFKSRMYL